MKKIILIILLIIGLNCCPEEPEGYQNIYFYIQYPGKYVVFFYNQTPEGDTYLYVAERQYKFAFIEDDLVPLIGELHLLNIRVRKVIGDKDPDKGKLIFEAYDESERFDKFIIPYGEDRAEVDYIF